MGQYFYGPAHLFKVRLSMARLLTVVNERKKIRNDYRRHLEAEYINEKKQEEEKEWMDKREKMKQAG